LPEGKRGKIMVIIEAPGTTASQNMIGSPNLTQIYMHTMNTCTLKDCAQVSNKDSLELSYGFDTGFWPNQGLQSELLAKGEKI
jgi:hypothetical protein